MMHDVSEHAHAGPLRRWWDVVERAFDMNRLAHSDRF